MNTSERIQRRENRLLRWESYLRRSRHVALGLALLMIIAPIAFVMANSHLGDEQPATFFVGLFLLMWAGLAHAKIRHIETIKRNREPA